MRTQNQNTLEDPTCEDFFYYYFSKIATDGFLLLTLTKPGAKLFNKLCEKDYDPICKTFFVGVK